jgi:hypothetical protein
MTTGQQTPDGKVRVCPPPPKDFDPFTASQADLKRHGLPLRPDPYRQPGMAALWERQARRYRHFDHLELRPDTATAAKKPVSRPFLDPFALDPTESCGYQLTSTSEPFTALFVSWTVPDLRYSPSQTDPFDNHFHTFVGLGIFLDVQVEMTVDPQGNVTSNIGVVGITGLNNLTVRPGDVISGSLCLETNQAGTAGFFFANETTATTISFTVDGGFPPAYLINAGVSRGFEPNLDQYDPLASFGVVYFDEISAYTTSGSRSLTSGDATAMVDQNGQLLASPVRLTDYTFKTVFVAP